MAVTFEKIAGGIPGAEGPVVDNDGRLLLVCPGKGQVLALVDGELDVVAQYDGVPAGLQIDRENQIWIADMKRGIVRCSPDGRVEAAVDTWAGQPIRGCNDLYFDSAGHLYFTAPAGSNDTRAVGEVFCLLADGQVRRVDDSYQFSNGIVVSDDDGTLIVAETYTRKLWAYDLPEPGRAVNRREFAELPDDGRKGGPDGMDFDAEGNLIVAHFNGSSLDVFDPQGKLIERVDTPCTQPTNVHFAGADSREVYVTAIDKGELFKFTWKRSGQLQYNQK